MSYLMTDYEAIAKCKKCKHKGEEHHALSPHVCELVECGCYGFEK